MNEEMMLQEQLLNNIGKPLDSYSQADIIHSFEFPTRSGRIKSVITSNTLAVLIAINKLSVYHFGCIHDLTLESIHGSMGTELTLFYDSNKRYKDTLMLNKRFLSNILYAWSKALRIRYIDSKTPKRITGVKLWCTSYAESTPMLTGTDAIQLLKDLIFLIDKNKKTVSDILYEIMLRKPIKDVDDRIFHKIQAYDRVWIIPIYNLIYLKSLVKELQSGKYVLDMEIPIVKNLWKTPLRCTDYTAKRVKI